ncbi:TetR family transcriptional regulator C-terminal domain-containing protein [Roseicyclus sp. F158]|uniref:TetR family transcriptional regulator C-terminal domain-containing protein n=1 Tax=Tropicimonas omnivorans TaxID=3075590 RepID=A0ABU3DH13_9RHOB|nr:TetR family transcriptional regulator C-terminal domain-containing protein [Roseicyclus sp. F158]MDT0683006.1 TetR family transcriptional regulator C-terminal domain-containing protein [Roseicyclus sp. F158]
MSRIQKRNRARIAEAALEVFSRNGFRGATLDAIAGEAGLSKPNLIYYYPSKETIYEELLTGLLSRWLEPLTALDPAGEPEAEILGYVSRKLDLSRQMPRESRLFANEILRGAPLIAPHLTGPLHRLVAEKAAVIEGWAAAGRIAPVDGRQLIMSIWALTQHYVDADVQVRAVTGMADPLAGAAAHLETLFRRTLRG